MVDLEGLVFNSPQFGYCKVVSHLNRQVQVRFCGTGREAVYTLETLLRGKDFKWVPLPAGLRCTVEGRGECSIVHSPFGPDQTTQVHEYTVEFESQGRETAALSERDLWPIPGSLTETPQTRLAGLRLNPWTHFRARDDLFSALARLHRETAPTRRQKKHSQTSLCKPPTMRYKHRPARRLRGARARLRPLRIRQRADSGETDSCVRPSFGRAGFGDHLLRFALPSHQSR